jgi:hypothetical protein
MKENNLKVYFVACVSILIASISFAGDVEKDLLKSCERIKVGVETGISLDKYSDLLSDAITEYNIYIRNIKKDEFDKNKIFIEHIESSLDYFKEAKHDWEEKIRWKREYLKDKLNQCWECLKIDREGQRDAEKYMQENWAKALMKLDLAYKNMPK